VNREKPRQRAVVLQVNRGRTSDAQRDLLDGRLAGRVHRRAVAIGGSALAAEVAELGLIDEYRAMVYPVLVGGGIPYFPRDERRVDLELVETRTFGSGVVHLRYRVAR
jgi:dihydrofolate reductase